MGAKGFVRDAWQAGGRGGGVRRCGAAEVAPPLEEVERTRRTVTARGKARCARRPEALGFSCTRRVRCPVHQTRWKPCAPDVLEARCTKHIRDLGEPAQRTQGFPRRSQEGDSKLPHRLHQRGVKFSRCSDFLGYPAFRFMNGSPRM